MSGKNRKFESPNEKDQQNRDYLKNYINPILEPLVKELLLEKPENIHEFIIDFVRNDLKATGSSGSAAKGGSAKGKPKQEYQFPESGSEEEEENEDVAPLSQEIIQKKSHTRHSVSAEAFGQYNKRSVFQPRVVVKTPEQVQTIVEKLSKSFMFSVLDDKQKKIVIDALDVKKYKKDDWIIKQGEDGDVLYIVQEGTFDCYKQFAKDQEPKKVKVYGPGDSFGELALLYNAPRAASIQATSDAVLCLLDRETFNAIVKDAEVQRRERFERTLEKVSLLSTMDPYERTKLSDVIKVEKYKAGDYVIRQGEEGHTFYFIEEGTAVCTKTLQGKTQPEQVLTYKTGDYFGELALLRNEPRQANVIADSELSLLVLDREVFNRVLGPLKEILARNAKKYEEYM